MLAGFWAVVAIAETPPTLDQLIDVALQTPLATTNPVIKSYEVESECMGMRASFWYTAPHRTALWVLDSKDGTPILAAADGMVAFYDTIASNVLLITNMYGALNFSSHYSQKPGKSSVKFGYDLQGDPTNLRGEILLPRKIESTNFRAELRPLGVERYEVRGTDSRTNPMNGQTMKWTFSVVADWPPQEIPYRSLEFRGEPLLMLTVKSVNEAIPASAFQFPLQALLTSGLPIRRLALTDTNGMCQMFSLLTVNLRVRQALRIEDPEKARESLRSICKDFSGKDTGSEIDRLFKDPAGVEKMLAEMSPENWESTRTKLFPDLSPQEFNERRKDPAFLKELAAKIATGISKPIDEKTGQGTTYLDFMKVMTASFTEEGRKLDQLDLVALQERDRKIASQLRQAFQLETSPAR
jgi:hypothetical protein